MERTYIKDLKDHVGESVCIRGWISVRRDQGKMVFFDVRDMTGSVQTVVLTKSPALEVAKTTTRESAISIMGTVNKRPGKNITVGVENGDIEVSVGSLDVLGASDVPPFEITEDTSMVDEKTRLQYRYLDLRSERMQKNIRLRSEFVRACREYLFAKKFTEIETPLLTESTPEGSRDFVVPSRLHPGSFYALPQSPQQYKQLLMVAGMERYFQIARAVRDEDLRADRGFEHSQIDIEMSFVEQEDVMAIVEDMMTETVEKLGFKVREKPFPRFTYAEAMEKFGADKFDLRTDDEKKTGVLAYAWVHKFPFFEKTPEGGWTFTHNPFSAPLPEHADDLLHGRNIEHILTAQYDLVCNGFETAGGSIRAHRPGILRAVYKTMGYSDERIEDSIGHMLKAFTYGAPPHGGIAIGIERVLMNLTGESYLREVQAFPMTRGGQTAVMNAPKPLQGKQLNELGIEIKKKKV
ncbi:MAG: Aspartyl-tRNA synthetase [Parcubacteria group bacterium Gr01-1014_8]|nr:MAG: Aspartyl-tRNA synthetase [Parcubacteria group bacterium Gr01-1014_8]